MKIDTKAITRDQEIFYNALFSNIESYVEIRLFNREGKKEGRFFLTVNDLFNYHTPQDKNVYIGIFERGTKRNGKIENCTRTNAIWLDFDNMELEEIKFRIDMAGIPQPSMIISSGHGYHVYWLLDKPRGHEVKPILDKLASTIHADTASTDIARVLRVPDTMNVKGHPVPCEMIEYNKNITSLERFEKCLGIKASKPIETRHTSGIIAELASIKFNGLNNMASGVGKGERNFCTGRIVQTLRRLNYTKQEVTNIVMQWNALNKPAKSIKEVKQDIRIFWHDERYRYDGKEFLDDRLQELNTKFIDDDTTFFKGDNLHTHNYDNDLLGDDFYKISGLTFAVLSIIKMAEDEGITLRKIANLCRRNARDKTLLATVKFLTKRNHLHEEKRNGQATIYKFKEKPFSDKRGYTAVPKLLHKLYIESCNAKELERELNIRVPNMAYDRLNETRYKMLILLESYAYDSKREVFPTNRTIAEKMRVHSKTVKRNLEWLEDNQYIKTHKKEGKRVIRLIYS